MSKELKPCPSCGSSHVSIKNDADEDGFGTFLNVKCWGCGMQSGQQFASQGNDCPQTYAEVRERWNRRTPLPAEQPSNPVALNAIQKWEDRISPGYLEFWTGKGYGPAEGAMMGEIADLRAELARIVGQQTKGGGNA